MMQRERGARAWTLLSAGAAPVFLIGGGTIAAARQPASFDPMVDSISALAARANAGS